jgi:hypothetical protein
MTRLRIIYILQYAKCIKLLGYLNWWPAGNSTHQLETQNEGNCLMFIKGLGLYAFLNMLNAYNPKPANE